jgi:hypothetical protein
MSFWRVRNNLVNIKSTTIQEYLKEEEDLEVKFDKEGVRKQGSKKNEQPKGAHHKLLMVSRKDSFPA